MRTGDSPTVLQVSLREHTFSSQWNHDTHYFPMLAARIPAPAARVLDVGCEDGTFRRSIENGVRIVVGADLDASVLPPATGGRRTSSLQRRPSRSGIGISRR